MEQAQGVVGSSPDHLGARMQCPLLTWDDRITDDAYTVAAEGSYRRTPDSAPINTGQLRRRAGARGWRYGRMVSAESSAPSPIHHFNAAIDQ